jgi:hypothetical protein
MKVTFAATSAKVTIQGSPVFVQGDFATVAACPFTIPPSKPQPCVVAKLALASAKVVVESRPAVLKGPADLCQSAEQIPQGPVIYGSLQTKVIAT